MLAAVEIERKYAADANIPLPPLGDLPGVTTEGPPRTIELDATYFDTSDLRLAARNVRLRRRTGGADEGWHAKMPGPEGVSEFRLPLGRSTRVVPAQLRRLVDSYVRGAALSPIAQITTRRTERDLLGPDGRALVHIAEDDVTGRDLASGSITSWREIEVELADGLPRLLDIVEKRLATAGIRRSTSASKLSDVLAGGAATAPAVTWAPAAEPPRRSCPAGEVAHFYLRTQVAALLHYDPKVRQDEPDAVHRMRVATRRMRSALLIFRPLLDRAVTDHVAAELKWLAEELGAARDQEVQRDALLGQLAQLPAELVIGPVAARIKAVTAGGYARAHRELLEELSGPRYFALLDALDALIVAPPFTAAAREQTAAVGIPPLIRKADRRLRRDIRAALAVDQLHERELALHEARKAAKRLRYACESVATTFGRKAVRLATAAESMQELLGEHQDDVVRRALLREMALAAYAAGENTFTYGLLAGLAHERARQIETEVPAAWAAAGDPKLRRWLH